MVDVVSCASTGGEPLQSPPAEQHNNYYYSLRKMVNNNNYNDVIHYNYISIKVIIIMSYNALINNYNTIIP